MKHIFDRYKKFIMHMLAPLGGPWAVFLLCLVDAAAFGVPLDPVMAYYVYTDTKRAALYVFLGALGSCLGSLVPYAIGYWGGEAVVVKRIGQRRFARVHARVERYGVWALVIPSMLPPPTPFKLFVFSAGVAEMSWVRFTLSVFFGRLMRFAILAGLTLTYGPQIVDVFQGIVRRHWHVALVVAALAVLALLFFVRRTRDVESVGSL